MRRPTVIGMAGGLNRNQDVIFLGELQARSDVPHALHGDDEAGLPEIHDILPRVNAAVVDVAQAIESSL